MNKSTAANLDLSHLVNLIDELRAAGYDISTQQYIAAQNLLIALAARNELPRELRTLRTWLAPVICSTPREQENFYRYFDRWVTRHPELTTRVPIDEETRTKDEEIFEKEHRGPGVLANSSWLPLMLLGVIAVGVVMLFWLRPRLQQINGAVVDNETNQRLAGVTISFRGLNQTTDNSGGFSVAYRPQELPKDLIAQSDGYETNIIKVSADTKSPLEVRLQQPIPLPAEQPGPPPGPSPTPTAIPLLAAVPVATSDTSQRARWIGFASVAFPFFMFAGWWLWQSKFNRGLLRRLQSASEPQLEQLIVKGAGAQLFQRPEIRRTIQELRRHRQRGANELDATRTVFSTIDNGGLFTPAYGLRQTLPEYLVLIDRASLADHQAKFDDEFVRRLIQDNVFVDAYHFQGDPRFCRPALRNSAYVSLQEMAARHPDHHLIIFSDAGTFINPISGAPERWIENFAPWAKRILITPESPSYWGTTERTLGELGFIVLPAGADGFAALSDVVAGNVPRIDLDQPTRPFPSMLRDHTKRWLENHEPQATKVERLCDQLRIFLGPKGYQWLSACAIYPLLYWEMTLFLGRGWFLIRLNSNSV